MKFCWVLLGLCVCAYVFATEANFIPYQNTSFVQDVKGAKTGFFHMEQQDEGRWWVIDPLGRGIVLLGVDHVNYSAFYSTRLKYSPALEYNKKRFPTKADWETNTLARLQKWGFNMLGDGGDRGVASRGMIRAINLNLGQHMCGDQVDPDWYILQTKHAPCTYFPNVFSPAFAKEASRLAEKLCTPHQNNPWILGYFIDNELAWRGKGQPLDGLYQAILKLPPSHSAYQALQAFLTARGVTGEAPTPVKEEFLRLIAEMYFHVTKSAIQHVDPNHMILGCRFAGLGGAHRLVWQVAARECALLTFNCYPWVDLDRGVVKEHAGANARRMNDIFQELDRNLKCPLMVTEWSFPALDSGLPCRFGAGQRFDTQAQRTQASELFARTMLAQPNLVGYSYFMWIDEPAEGLSDAFPEDSNYGLINVRGEPYRLLTDMFTRIQHEAGALRRAPVPAEKVARIHSCNLSDEHRSPTK